MKDPPPIHVIILRPRANFPKNVFKLHFWQNDVEKCEIRVHARARGFAISAKNFAKILFATVVVLRNMKFLHTKIFPCPDGPKESFETIFEMAY